MKPSTLAELAGFACLCVCAFLANRLAGFAVTGASLLLIGYAIEDAAAALSVHRMLVPFQRRYTLARVRHANRRSRRRDRRRARQRERRPVMRRQPAEIILHVDQR